MADDLKLKAKIEVDDGEVLKIETAGEETRRILREAAEADETYTERVTRQARERISELQTEHTATVALINKTRAEKIKHIDLELKSDVEAVESARKAAVLKARAEGASLQERLAVYKKFTGQIRELEESAAKNRGSVNTNFDSLIGQAGTKFEAAKKHVEGTTTALGQFKAILEPVTSGIRNGTLSLDDMTASLGNAAGAAGPLGVAIGALVAGIGVLKGSADAASQYKSELEGVARAGAINEKTAAGLILALQRVGGNAGDAQGLVSQFTTRLDEATSGSADAVASFARLGISAEDLKSKSPDEILFKISDALLKIEDQQGRVRGASEIFGDDDAVKIAKVAGSLRAVSDEAEKLGLVLGPQAKQQIEAYQAQVNELGAQWEAFKVRFGTGGAGILSNTLEFWTGFFGGSGQIQQDTEQIGRQAGEGVKQGIKKTPPPEKSWWQSWLDLTEGIGGAKGGGIEIFNKWLDEIDERSIRAAKGQEILARQTVENRKAFEDLASALKTTAEEAALIAGGSPEQARKRLTELQAASSAAAAAIKETGNSAAETAEKIRSLQGAVSESTEAVNDAVEAEKRLTESARSRMQAVELGNAALARNGKSELEIAKRNATEIEQITQEQLDAAQRVYDARTEAANNAYALEIRRAGKNVDLILKAAEAQTQRLAQIQNDYDQKALSATQQREAAQVKIEEAAAVERSKLRQRESEDLKLALSKDLDALKVKEDSSVGFHESAYQRRLAITQQAIQREIDLLNEQLRAENVGAAERERLTQEIRSKELELAGTTANAESELHARRIQDANELMAVKNGQADVERAQVQAQIAQLSATSQLEQQNAGVIAGLKQRLLELDAQKLQAAVESRTAVVEAAGGEIAADTELLRLKAQLITLEGERGAAAVAASERAIDAATREKGAVEGVTGALGQQAQAATTAYQASGAPIDTNSLEGLSRAIEAARTNYQNLRNAFTGSTGTGPGAFGFLNSAAQYLTQIADLERQQAEMMRAEAETARQERLEAAKRDAAEMDRIRESELDATERANDRLREAEKRFRKGMAEEVDRWGKQEAKLLTDGQKALESIQSEWDSRRASRAKTEADRLLQIEQDLQKSRRDTELSARQSALDNEASRIVSEAEARKKLADPKASAEDKKEAEGQLADIEAARSRDKRQAEEEALARSKATSAEELQIQLDAIRDKYRNEAEFYEQSKGLQGSALEALKSNFAAQQAAIEQARRDALADLSRRLSEEKTARDTAAAEEDAEYSSRLDKQREANRSAFDEARRAHVEKLGELQDALSKEEAEHEKSLAAIQTQTEEALAKMGKTWGDYFKFVKDGISSIGGTPGGGQPGSDSGAGGNDKGGGNGASIRTSDNDSGKITSGTSPGGDGKGGNSQRTPPPSPPPPKPTPPPAPSTGKTDFAEVGSNPFGQPQDQTDKFFNRDARPMLAQVVNLLKKGDTTGARDVFGVLRRLFAQRESSLTPEFAKSVSSTLEVYEKKLKEAEGQSNSSEGGGQQIVQDHARPNPAGDADAIGGGLKDTDQDKPGGPKATGTDTKPTPDKPADKPAPKPFDPGKEGADFPTTAQLLLQRLTKGEITQAEALAQWEKAKADNPALLPYDQKVKDRIKAVGSKAKSVTGTDAGPKLTAQTVPDVRRGGGPSVFVPALNPTLTEAAERGARAERQQQAGGNTFNLNAETFDEIVAKLRRAAQQVGIPGA